MRPDSYTARSYLLINEAVQVVEKRLATQMKSACRLGEAAISRRIAQAVTMCMVDPFLKQSIGVVGKSDIAEGLPRKFCCGELEINTETGSVVPTKKLLFFHLVKFLTLWLFVCVCFMRSLLSNRRGSGQAVLVYGVPDANLRAEGSAKRFEDFCQNGPLDVLTKARKYIVQAIQPVTSDNSQKFVYTRFPLLTLFSLNQLGIMQSIGFIKEHVR